MEETCHDTKEDHRYDTYQVPVTRFLGTFLGTFLLYSVVLAWRGTRGIAIFDMRVIATVKHILILYILYIL